jgi:hydrogenase nickel incorporation protein HypA/HybF
MHEFAIAEALVQAVLAEMEQAGVPGGALRRATVVIGVLQQVVPENLTQAYRVLTEETPAKGSELTIQSVPVQAICRKCGWQGAIRDGLYLCPACAARGVDVVAGRELYLAALEVNERDDLNQSIPEPG